MPPAPARAESVVQSRVRFGRTKDPNAPQSNRSRQSRERTRGAAADPACGVSASAPRVNQRRRPARPNACARTRRVRKNPWRSECSLRTLSHGSGRNRALKGQALDRALVARCSRERPRSERPAGGRLISAHLPTTLCLLVRCAITRGEFMTGPRPPARRRIAPACGTIRGGFADGACMRGARA